MKKSRKNAIRRPLKQPISGQPATSGPSSADLLLQKGLAHHSAGQLPQAEAIYRQILQASPNHAGALHLLGVVAHQAGQYAAALELIDRALQLNPDFAEACCSRGNALFALQQCEAAVESYDKAILLKPDFAEAHHNRGSALHALLRHHAALESYDRAILLKPDYAEAFCNRGIALLALQQHQAALESFDKAILLQPDYAGACSNRDHTRQALEQYRTDVEIYHRAMLLRPDDECNRQTTVFESVENAVARIAKISDKAEMKAALDALPPDLHSHPAVSGLRNANFVKSDANGKDIVFYCGPTSEIWNPRTAREKGIGGSEEAVIWLSTLLHRRGWRVTVYAYCGARQEVFDGISWKPYWMWNCRDRQNVTVLWRYPLHHMVQINSDMVVMDLHDVIPEAYFTPEMLQRIDRIFVKSKFHRSLFPHIPDQKFVIIPNGIDAKLFEGPADRDPLLLINTSSADRSLEAFIDCFEEIKKQVPNARAQWAYGWGVWDSVYSSDSQKMAWKTGMQQRIKQIGVEERGRLSHGEIAQLYLKANVFAYPSEYAEIDCISLSKAMAAGAIPITTDFAALGEKSQHGGVFIHSKKTKDDWAYPNKFHFEITDPEQKAEFIRETVKLLLNPPSEKSRESMREWARSTFDWNRIADSWDSALASLLAESKPAPEPASRAVPVDPAHAEACCIRGNELYLARQYQAALESYDKAIQLNPWHAQAFNNRGSALHALQQDQAALVSFDKAILLQPDYAEAFCNRGISLHALQQHQEALDSFDKAILLQPDYAEAYNNRGNTLYLLARYEEALNSFDKAILLNPDYAEAYSDRANTLYALQRFQAALHSCDRAILLNPQLSETHFNRGNALHALHQYEAAVQSYDKAILLNPDYAEAYSNRGNTLHDLQQFQEALDSCDRAILLKPELAEAHNNRGNALLALHQYQEAVESYDRAILLNPRHAKAHCNRGNALHALDRYQAALESCDQAILLQPEIADAHYNRGNALQDLKQYQEALASYDKALLINPDYAYLRGMPLFTRGLLCDWADIENECRQLEAAIDRGLKAVLPFTVLAISNSPAVQMQAAQIYARDRFPARSAAAVPRRPKRDRIRIGYFSADFRYHATSFLIAELLERHDRSRFEILGFSFGPDTADEMSKRVSSAMDQFLDVRSMPDHEVADLSRKLEVDIAVDLKGFTKQSRTGIFAERAAPIQISYLGYPGTMGADFMDYLIADPTLIPEADRQYYSEKILTLPDSYQVNDSLRSISPEPCARAGEGLPESAFVFCCFNGAYKITPDVFDLWMHILARVEGSVLWLLEDNPWAIENLRAEAARRGIAPQRLVFARLLPAAQHLARHRLADLFLDTLPYNAHTTASDALWAGLPLLTRTGETFAGRVAASLLRAVGLPELITSTESEYEELSVDLAHNPARLHALRQRLQQNRLTAPLFDCPSFTRHLESAYTAIYDRYHSGLPPDHIHIPRCR